MTDKPVPTMRELIDIVKTHNEILELEEDELEEGQVRLELIPLDDEEKDSGQPGYRQFFEQIAAAGVDIAAINTLSMEEAGSISILSGAFVLPLAQVVGPIASAALVAWFQGKAGRKVRIKVGDIEVEARTKEEATLLLQRAVATQAQRDGKPGSTGDEP